MTLSPVQRKIGIAVLAVVILAIILFALLRGMNAAKPTDGAAATLAPQPVGASVPSEASVVQGPEQSDAAEEAETAREERESESEPTSESPQGSDRTPPAEGARAQTPPAVPAPSAGSSGAVPVASAGSLATPGTSSSDSAPAVVLADADRLTQEEIKAFGALFKEFKTYETPEPFSPNLKITKTDGRVLSVGDFRGAWFVVNFWASWCPPCVEELPALSRVANKLQGSRVQVIAVSLDSKLDAKGVEAFVREKALGDAALYVDLSGEIQKALGTQGLPVTLIIDPSGAIRWRVTGIGKWDDPSAERFLRLLAREG